MIAWSCGIRVTEVTICPQRVADLVRRQSASTQAVFDGCAEGLRRQTVAQGLELTIHPGLTVIDGRRTAPGFRRYRRLEGTVMYMLAGRLTELRWRRACGEAVAEGFDLADWMASGGITDAAVACATLGKIVNPDRLPEALAAIAQRTESRLQHPKIWHAVTAVAAALIDHDTLNRPTLLRLIRSAIR